MASTTIILVQATIIFCLDYCSGIITSVPASPCRPWSIVNTVTMVILLKLKSDHITPSFSISLRVKGQVITMVYKDHGLHGLQRDLTVPLTSFPTTSCTCSGYFYLRVFALTVPSAWNVLHQLATWLGHSTSSTFTKRYFLRRGFLYYLIENYNLYLVALLPSFISLYNAYPFLIYHLRTLSVCILPGKSKLHKGRFVVVV